MLLLKMMDIKIVSALLPALMSFTAKLMTDIIFDIKKGHKILLFCSVPEKRDFMTFRYINYFPPGGQFFLRYSVNKVRKCSVVPSPSLILCERLG